MSDLFEKQEKEEVVKKVTSKEKKAKKKTEPKIKTGLGDVVEAVAESLNIKKCDDCEKRRIKLNRMFPFTRRAKKPTEKDIIFFEKIRKNKSVKQEEKNEFSEIYARVFKKRFKHCNCPSKYKTAIIDFFTVVDFFKKTES